MSDASDFDQAGEELDENLPADYPPDRPTGVYDEEATGVADPEADDDDWGDDPRDATQPEQWEAAPGSGTGPGSSGPPVLEGDADVGVEDREKDMVAPSRERDDLGPLANDDEFSGDETTRDVATEHIPPPAEESAVRVDDEPPGAAG